MPLRKRDYLFVEPELHNAGYSISVFCDIEFGQIAEFGLPVVVSILVQETNRHQRLVPTIRILSGLRVATVYQRAIQHLG